MASPERHAAGAIVLYSPARTVAWCLRRRVLPPLRVWLDLLASLFIGIVSRTTYSHVLQSVGGGFYVHTRMGLIRREADFPPGYMETSIALMPRVGFPPAVAEEFRKSVGRANHDFTVLPLTALYRLAYKLRLIAKDFRASHHSVQCASFVALTWRKAGYDLYKDAHFACYTGLYPGDYLTLPTLERCGAA